MIIILCMDLCNGTCRALGCEKVNDVMGSFFSYGECIEMM